MKEFDQIKNILINKSKELDNIKKKVEHSLKRAPEGALILSSSNGNVQYYHKTKSDQKKGKYIEKKNRRLITALAQKDYDQLFLKELEKQMKQISRMMKCIPEKELTDVYSKLSEPRKELVTPCVLSDKEYVEQWLKVEYKGKEFKSEMPYFITEKGEKVRSKTEKIIADKLNMMGIPYRYEYPLKLKGYGIVYPDFTLLNVSTRKEIYMEHFGMMDNPHYCQKAIQKIHTYARNDIYLGKNLILTFETLQTPLDMRSVEKMLQKISN